MKATVSRLSKLSLCFVVAASGVIAECVPVSSPPPAARSPAASAPIAAARSPADGARTAVPDWRDRPLTAGKWTWRRRADTNWSEAGFGMPERVAVSCVSLGVVRLAIQRPGGALTVRTGSIDRVIAPAAQSVVLHPTPVLDVDFAASDALLDAIAFSRGRFMLDFTGGAALILPAAPEVARVIEDCR